MGRLAFLADEHVDRAYVTALRSNGYRVAWLDDGSYDSGVGDLDLLESCLDEGLVVITNDVDFAVLGDAVDHAGIILYHQYDHSPRSFVRAITRIDRYITTESFRNHVEWLENWL